MKFGIPSNQWLSLSLFAKFYSKNFKNPEFGSFAKSQKVVFQSLSPYERHYKDGLDIRKMPDGYR